MTRCQPWPMEAIYLLRHLMERNGEKKRYLQITYDFINLEKSDGGP